MPRIIVDADVYAYSCGGATQKTLYDWVAVMSGDVIEGGIAENKADVEAARSSLPEGAEMHVTEIVDAEPLEHALALCKRSLLGVEQAVDEAGVEFDKLELYLTGKGNFRENIATIKGYKANRIGKAKPVHYKGIRRYMRERWAAQTAKGFEADDALAMRAHEHGYDGEAVILVSGDKDLRTVPGRHYNPRKKAWSIVTPQEALLPSWIPKEIQPADQPLITAIERGARTIEAIAAATGTSIALVTERIVSLELEGTIVRVPGAAFRLRNGS